MKVKYIGMVLLLAGFIAGFLFSPLARKSSPEVGESRIFREERSGVRPALPTESVGQVMSSESIGSLLDKAFAEKSEILATKHLMLALSQHRKETEAAFAAYFTAIPFSKDRFNHWRLFFSSWGTFDGPAALAFIRKRFDQAALQQEFYYSVIKSWNHAMPAGVLSEAGEFLLATPGVVGGMATDHVRELLVSDPEKGIMNIVRLSDPEAVMHMAGEHAARQARKDVRAALEMLRGVESDSKPYLTGRVLATWSEADPSGAANWLAKQGYPMIAASDLNAIAVNYVKVDAAAAFGWVNSLPDGLFSGQVLEMITAAWTQNDPAGSSAWLAKHNPASEYDPAVMALVRTMAGEDPAGALEASSSKIHDEAKAQETFFHIAMQWKEKQPEEFAKWLQNNNLIGSEQKARLQNREFHAGATSGQTATQAGPGTADDGRQ